MGNRFSGVDGREEGLNLYEDELRDPLSDSEDSEESQASSSSSGNGDNLHNQQLIEDNGALILALNRAANIIEQQMELNEFNNSSNQISIHNTPTIDCLISLNKDSLRVIDRNENCIELIEHLESEKSNEEMKIEETKNEEEEQKTNETTNENNTNPEVKKNRIFLTKMKNEQATEESKLEEFEEVTLNENKEEEKLVDSKEASRDFVDKINFSVEFEFDAEADCSIRVIWGCTESEYSSIEYHSKYENFEKIFYFPKGFSQTFQLSPESIPNWNKNNMNDLLSISSSPSIPSIYHPLVIILSTGIFFHHFS